MAKDEVKATEGLKIDRRLAVPEDVDHDHLLYLDEEIADAERRLKDAQSHLDELNKQKQERS